MPPPEDSLHETAYLLVNTIESSPDATLGHEKEVCLTNSAINTPNKPLSMPSYPS